ncbi:MAG: DMT family transporter [Chitinophagales bacterium]
MSGRLPAMLIGALAGLLMAVQGTFNTQLAKAVGRLEATMVVQGVGLAAALLLLYPLGLGRGHLSQLKAAPWFALLGGVLGVAIVFTVVAAVSRLGMATATTAILVGQILTAAAVDHFGLFGMERLPFGWLQLLGLGLFAAGARILLS